MDVHAITVSSWETSRNAPRGRNARFLSALGDLPEEKLRLWAPKIRAALQAQGSFAAFLVLTRILPLELWERPLKPQRPLRLPSKPCPSDLVPHLREPLAQLAARAGVGIPTLRRWRQEEGAVVTCGGAKYSPETFRARLEIRHPGLVDQLGRVQDADLARGFGLCRERVRQFRLRLGIPVTPDGRLARLNKWVVEGASAKEIAEATSLCVQTVQARARVRGVKLLRAPRDRGQVSRVLELAARPEGVTSHELAVHIETTVPEASRMLYRLRIRGELPRTTEESVPGKHRSYLSFRYFAS